MWKLHGDGRSPRPGEAVKPDERLSWPRMAGLGAQHVVAMFGATFVFPLVMGLDPNVAIMMSGVATILFLLLVKNKVPSYLGTSASFVGGVVAIRAAGGDSATVTGAILVAGLVLAACGLAIHFLGASIIDKVFPPVVTGAVVMLIGFGLAFVVADVYWPVDPWMALATMAITAVLVVGLKGFLGRIGILLGLIAGFALSWVVDLVFGPRTGADGTSADRVDFSAVGDAAWFGLPEFHGPAFSGSAIVLVLPAVIALIAENIGHVQAVGEMTRTDLKPYVGRAVAADGIATALSTSVGGSPTTTYAENIGVMAATRVYSTLAYYIAAAIAIAFGFVPKFGALIAATPSAVLGGIGVILYGMIGLLGAKIWVEHKVDFAKPLNMVPIGAGILLAIGPVAQPITGDFSLSGIALGTAVVLLGYHLLRPLAKRVEAADRKRAPAEES
ncbi:uracil-xanthine permease family protein [Glycomyces dulcitolivorans]|uniref:uracil-xanthine permease family protein n=1 Tax=Glycomyces dulcitolivorans TaxID=2200759 RepID=UPI000DD2F404|nr:solute carrier family 23 protein [Glycomyces dulcitolivorans]